jgi:hypothetical protein
MKREKALETLNGFPLEFDLEELIERLVFVEKIEKGIKQLEEGKITKHEDVAEKVKGW